MPIWNPIADAPTGAADKPAGPVIVAQDADGRVAKTRFVRHPVKGDEWIMQEEDGAVLAWDPIVWVPAYLPMPELPQGAVVAHTEYNVDWLPQPNQVELVLTDVEAPEDLTRTAFMVPYTDTWAVVLAHHTQRGVEMAGGHIEPRETMLDAALRELREETGVEDVIDHEPLGFLRMFCSGRPPEGVYAYPFPLSYQQIYTGRAKSLGAFEPTEECHEPVVIGHMADPRVTRETVRVYGAAARNRAKEMI